MNQPRDRISILLALLAAAGSAPLQAWPGGYPYGYAPPTYSRAYYRPAAYRPTPYRLAWPARGLRAAPARAPSAAPGLPAPSHAPPPAAPAPTRSVSASRGPADRAAPPEANASPPKGPDSGPSKALTDLDHLLAYSLEGEKVVPRFELSHLPRQCAESSDTELRKQRFVKLLLPLVLMENERIVAERASLQAILARLRAGQAPAAEQRKTLARLARAYRVRGDPTESAAARAELLRKVDTLPVSLVLAQAANESAWGRSRFANEGRNLFGIWTYDERHGMVPKRRAAGKRHLVRRFDTLRESVRYYMRTLNSHPAYARLRELRAESREQGHEPDGVELAKGLERYSERGQTYVRLIQQIILRNDLAELDQARLSAARG